MKLYRFSPIRSQVELLQALEYVHETCNRLCFETVGTYLPVRGNIGIFCHDYAEFTYLTGLREKLTNPSPNYNEKYFPLKQPITFAETVFQLRRTNTSTFVRLTHTGLKWAMWTL